MMKFAQITAAPEPRTKDSKKVAIFFAGVITVMLVAQLFTFEDVLVLFGDTFGQTQGQIIAALIVTIELFALPFLLRMQVSKAFRWVSLVCAGLVGVLWVVIAGWTVSMQPGAPSVGFLGSFDPLGAGLWAVFVAFALTVLGAWSIYGLWPLQKKK